MLIKIDTYAAKPIYEQLRDGIILGIASGQLAESEPLPSARSLAADLGVNFHTVNKAYDALRRDGYIAMDRRKTAVVAAKKAQMARGAQDAQSSPGAPGSPNSPGAPGALGSPNSPGSHGAQGAQDSPNARALMPAGHAEKLSLCAAEAICNGVGESAFAELCVESYRKIKGGGVQCAN
jgi:DNA-binding transcriptional regulator YhcF (GntR family)